MEVRAENFARDAYYVEEVRFNGNLIESLEIAHAEIVRGGELVFRMTTCAETARGRGKLRRPFSLSTES